MDGMHTSWPASRVAARIEEAVKAAGGVNAVRAQRTAVSPR